MLDLDTHPSRYRHWRLAIDGDVARLNMAVREEEPFRPGYTLKLNSYDLGVDIELADAVQRLRFEHPEVRCVVVGSDRDRVFCAGANIHMLAASKHPFKVNFCKFTNETRLAIEDGSRAGGARWLAALNGACAGGGYELALACDEIVLIEDGSSTVSLPEVPLLGVLPGTGGLTRLVDKRKVRRDHADVFCTLAEGLKGKRAVDMRLIDASVPRSRFADEISTRARKLAQSVTARAGAGVPLDALAPGVSETSLEYRHVTVNIERARRVAVLTINAPAKGEYARDASLWALRAFRELDDALVRLRFDFEDIGMVLLRTRGNAEAVLAADAALLAAESGGDWFASEVILNMARVIRRLEATARTFFAVVDEGSCFAGSLLELALASDRTYMLDADGVTVQASALNGGPLPPAQGGTRIALRVPSAPARAAEIVAEASKGPLGAATADKLALVTVTADDIDFEDEVRVAVEERLSLSPDSLTGLEQNLRFAGAETLETKIFGRLSAWQNWIFIRPNATGERGALTMYGKPERPQFDARRT